MKLHQMICDHMVLQANKPIRLSGESKSAVEVEFAARTFRAEPLDGKWELTLPATAYGGPIEIKFRSDGEEKVVKDVMIGEVILCAGQSNIQFTCGAEGRNDIKNNGNIRFFNSDCIEARLVLVFAFSGKQVGLMKRCAIILILKHSSVLISSPSIKGQGLSLPINSCITLWNNCSSS